MYNYVNKNRLWGINNMKPRIFVSSTFYDLKYIREELSNYIKVHDFEPIMFEDSDIGYTPGRPLDESCYDAMRSADMVVLIIGGEYGSVASEDSVKDFEEYISVTRKEFRTALESGIPIFCMIDSNVNTEYGVYDANSENIEDNGLPIKFKTTKNINVFRFIKEIRTFGSVPIQEFKNVSEIKEFLGKQWADMFKNYLGILKNRTENKKLENSVKEMSKLIQKMDLMLDNVGKNILTKNNSSDYEKVVNQQDLLSLSLLLIDIFTLSLKDISLLYDEEYRKEIVTEFVDIFRQKKTIETIKNLLDNWEVKNVKSLSELFRKEKFCLFAFKNNRIDELLEKEVLLSKDDNVDSIIKILTEKENFDELIRA